MRFWMLLPLLTGCEAISGLKDKVEGLTNPLVIEAIYLGVEEPDAGTVDLSGTDFDQGVFATAFLADAASVTDLANAPVEGAEVNLRSEALGNFPMNDGGGGTYTASGDDGLRYDNGDPVTISVELDGKHSATVVAPPAVDANIPVNHTAGEPLGVAAGDDQLTTLFVVVMDASSGAVTFDNRPGGIEELYELTHGGGALAVEIPGSAFPRASAYAVGVAGMNLTEDDQLDELNTALSAFLAGKFRFYPVSTL